MKLLRTVADIHSSVHVGFQLVVREEECPTEVLLRCLWWFANKSHTKTRLDEKEGEGGGVDSEIG
eukprot:3311150-Amphidinium_carterae.1